ncbi:MAG: 2TM domain-containing protein [Comamonadaceae bacterium]|nr:MAG: 2TM domain-containing protein [Comamonadaceae bacterium]
MNAPLDTDRDLGRARAVPAATEDELDTQARRRAGAKMGWYIHASVYLLVNLGLVALATARGGDWAVFPLLGWGIGLMVHGFVVFVATAGNGFYDRLVARERQALARQNTQDRW